MYKTDIRREKVSKAKRIVIKVGTSTITHENGRFNLTNMENLCRSIANLMNQGKEVILVSSGAIGVGVGKLRLPEKPRLIRDKQAVAAVGQSELMNMYSRILNDYNHIVAQILLTKDDIDEAVSRENVSNTFEALLEKQILPIVNENDTVSTREIYHNGTFGDNDMLSAMVAVLTGADLLIILSDIEGLYDSDPRSNHKANLIDHVAEITDEIEQLAGGAGTVRGTGGMRSKILAARIANVAGIDAVIANGSKPHSIDSILEQKAVGTLFSAQTA
ncbi:MAG: glutamate 5-kinase [Clostridia bacterium]|nr:glutamate 5-kinase [Clostridia bacterium]NCC75213.1 glutamate 5-kinase [Clostridia bacterium]